MANRGKVKMVHSGFDDEDFISRLPDEIITHILSYVPTKSSVATTVLSKRWNGLWVSVPNLEIGYDRAKDGCPVKKALFLNFLGRFFSLNNVPSVEKIRLQLTESDEVSHLNAWISSVALRSAKKIYLSICLYNFFRLPDNFFNQNNLVQLKFTRFCFEIPQSVRFPRLKTIHLYRIRLSHVNDFMYIKRLILGCPILRLLHLDILEWDTKLLPLYICSSTLRTLQLTTTHCYRFSPNSCNSAIIDAPNLGEIHLIHHFGARYEIINVSLWVKLYLSFHERKMRYEVLTNVPIWHNVNHLTLEIVWDKDWLQLPNLFHCAPNLVTFILLAEINYEAPCVWNEPDDVPLCFQSCLESVDITVSTVNECDQEEMRMISYILKNAIVLKDLFVRVDTILLFESEKEVLQSLLTLPRGSIACQLHIEQERSQDIHRTSSSDVYNSVQVYGGVRKHR